MPRSYLMAILAAASVAAFAPLAMAQVNVGPGTFGTSAPPATTTVKSSKSNTSDRMGGGGGAKAGGAATNRMGGGGGAKAGGAAKATNLNSSRSNTP